MGGGASKKKIEVVRREPLKTLEAITNNKEATSKIQTSLLLFPPGTKDRWNVLVNKVNEIIPVTEVDPDPLRIEISEQILKEILKDVYDSMDSAVSAGIALMRKHFDVLYDNHSVELAKQISQIERVDKNITDDRYCMSLSGYERAARRGDGGVCKL